VVYGPADYRSTDLDQDGDIDGEDLAASNGNNLSAMAADFGKIYDPEAKVYYYHNSHIGTPIMMTDENGAVAWQADYTPFGFVNVVLNTVENNLRFPGQYFDAETSLHYNWHRYYDPMTGRYLTPDPIGLAGGINPFVYTENNPINMIDPYGLDGFALEGGGGYASDYREGNSQIGKDYGSGIYFGVKPNSMGHAQIGAYTGESKPNDLKGSRVGGGVLFIRYYGDARDFFSGTLEYTSETWFVLSKIIYFDPITGEKKGWGFTLGGEGLGLVSEEWGTITTTSRCSLQD
ncbi:MAG: hypothetical protein GY699_26365, partial [Desulfobacteraceae bacterium]|nr:hypothetical protein [Desulfobacteraceae bacterium]